MTRRTLVGTAGFAMLAVLAAGCSPAPRWHTPSPPSPAEHAAGRAALVAFDSCADLLDGLHAAARRYPLPTDDYRGAPAPRAAAGANAGGDGAAAAPGQVPGGDYSTTNTAEPGVDEPDVVKTDGDRIVSAVDGTVRVVDAASRQVTGSLMLPAGALPRPYGQPDNLLMYRDHALVVLPAGYPAVDGGGVRPDIVPGGSMTQRLALVDLSGPEPTLAGTYDIDGQLVDARQVGSTVRVVIRSGPRPVPGRSLSDAPLDQWLPRYTVTNGAGTQQGQVDCTSVSRPATYTGSALLTVLTLDLSRPALGTGDPVTIVADASTVYSTGSTLYLAGTGGVSPYAGVAPQTRSTEVYALDTTGAARPRYLAAGTVPGYLINQYAMSEYQGDLRLATTSTDASAVYVLRRQGDRLDQIGMVGGLGKGQRVYGVRFAGPVGYVVTFRQTDPLYTVDLRDPARPAVTGALELTGYSAYLHPIGDGQLLGLGQEADAGGRVRGTQLSLFDVGNPAAPRRLDRYVLPNSMSQAQVNPHAFLYWAATGLVAVPVTSWGPGTRTDRGGVLALRVAGGTLTPLSWPSAPTGVLRVLIVGQSVWTLAADGMAASELSSLAPQARVTF